MNLALPSTFSAAAERVANGLTPAGLGAAKTAAAATTKPTTTGATVTSSDFLNLLVTEMKNQDPTQPTDPNAYIQQLVGVNSLQQLIAINEELKGAGTSTGSAQRSLPLSGL